MRHGMIETGLASTVKTAQRRAERIPACQTDRELSECLVRNGREFFVTFSIDRMMDRSAEIYKEVVTSTTSHIMM